MPFDDYSRKIEFNIEENDYALNDLFAGNDDNLRWICAIEQFYDEAFASMDALINSGSDTTIVIGGPLISEEN